MSSGLTANGLVIEVTDDIRTGMEADLRGTFFESLPLGDKTVLGQLVGQVSTICGRVWERLEQVNSSQDADKAAGPALEGVSVLTGTFRPPATKSYATLTLCGTPGTTVAAGAVVATASTAQLFDTRDTVVLALLTDWVTATPYVVGDRRTNASRCYQCITAGTSAAAPTTTAADITDGTAHWTYLGEGTAAVDVVADCEVTGPVVASAYDLTTIQTPVAGWSSARNILDATLGADEATDEALRLLREAELAGAGGTTKDATRAALLKLTGVISCTMFVNRSDVTDGNGLPPHSFEALVRGGTAQDIVDTIANNQPDGIATCGGTFGTHTDSEGNTEQVNYSVPSNVNQYIDISVNYDATLYPSDGDTEIKTAITTWGAGFPTDRDVDPSAVGAQAFAVDGVSGVTRVLVYTDVIGTPAAWTNTHGYVATPGARDVVTNDGGRCYICITSGTSAGSGGPTGVGTNITDGTAHWYFLGNIGAIAARQLAAFDSSRITVHSTAVAP
jgi:uncharacterized phage protein gp47/JayE